MEHEGPILEALTRRLGECPPDFLAEPRRPGGQGKIEVAAVVSDLLEAMGGSPLTDPEGFCYPNARAVNAHRNRLRLILVGAWLLFAGELRRVPQAAERAREWLSTRMQELSPYVQADQLVQDPDRREEFVRLALKALDLRPAGESIEQAQDRLVTLSSVERARVVKEAQAAERRAREIREEMARKAAEEAAAAWGRE